MMDIICMKKSLTSRCLPSTLQRFNSAFIILFSGGLYGNRRQGRLHRHRLA